MKKIYILLLLLSSQLINAQMVTVIETRFGDAFRADYGLQVLQTPDQGYVLFGTFYNVGLTQNDFRLIKVDANANVQWDSTYDMIDPVSTTQSTENVGAQVALTSDGGYVMIGYAQNQTFDFNEMLVIKVDANGTFEWRQTYGDGGGAFDAVDLGKSIRQISGGGYIIAGTSNFGFNGNIIMVKTDGSGNTISGWPKYFGDFGEEQVNDLEITTSGNYLLAGWSDDPNWPPSNDAYLLEVNPNGDSIWSKRYPAYPVIGDSKVDGEFLDLNFISNDTFIAVGNTQLDLGGTTNRPYFIKDFMGSSQATAPIKKDTFCCDTRIVRSVVFDSRDTSYTLTGEVGTNLMVMKMNSNYNEKWMSQHNLPINLEARGNSIILNDSGNYVILGTAKNDDGSGNIFDDFYLLILKDTTMVKACTGFSISPTNISVSGISGIDSVTVNNLNGCSWTATPDAGWITITSASSGTGNAIVNLSIAANTGAMRTGHIVFTTTQSPADTLFIEQGPVGINTISKNRVTVTISPNPFSRNAVISIEYLVFSKEKNLEFTLYDLLGREVHRQILNTKHSELNTDLPDGVYFYQLKGIYDILSRGKLVVFSYRTL